MMRRMKLLEPPSALENADFARALQHRHVHREADHGESDHHADADDHDDEALQPRHVVDAEAARSNSSIEMIG